VVLCTTRPATCGNLAPRLAGSAAVPLVVESWWVVIDDRWFRFVLHTPREVNYRSWAVTMRTVAPTALVAQAASDTALRPVSIAD
jgi:hypothetical protein